MLHSKKKLKKKADHVSSHRMETFFTKHSHATVVLAQAKNACAKTETKITHAQDPERKNHENSFIRILP